VIEYDADSGMCPDCNTTCSKHDNRNERTWRHLDTMQFTTYIRCAAPRVTHGVKSVDIPWASKHSRFTLLFEASVEETRKLLNLNWHQVENIKRRAVERGLNRREERTIEHLGIDEKQFRSGQDYISCLVDLDGGRVLDVVEKRTEKASKALIDKALTEKQQSSVVAVALDMWAPYATAVEEKLPQADIVHDRFHISGHLNEAVNKVRKNENRELREFDDDRLVGSKYYWLTNEENVKEYFEEIFGNLKHSDLKTARAWAIKELFRDFWTYTYAACAEKHFNKWYSWAIRSRIEPIKKVLRG